MYVKRFHGSTVAEALAAARRELGEEALLLETLRPAAASPGREIEVRVAVERPRPGPRPPQRPGAPLPAVLPAPPAILPVPISNHRSPVTGGAASPVPLPTPGATSGAARGDSFLLEAAPATVSPAPAAARPRSTMDSDVRWPEATGTSGVGWAGRDAPAGGAEAGASAVSYDRRVSDLQERFQLLSRRMDSLIRGLQPSPEPECTAFRPPSSDEIVGWLVAVGFELDMAEGIARSALGSLQRPARTDEGAVRGALTGALAGLLPECAPAPSGRRRIVALVGPAGSGKTTTAVKLAARASLAGGERVLLVAADGYRIGAVEQITEYAELIGVPIVKVRDAADLGSVLACQTAKDLIVIDTTGVSPTDSQRLRGLRQLLDAAPGVEILLVLPATTRRRDLGAAISRFRALGPLSLVLTRLDETSAYGELLAEAASSICPVAWLAAGPSVPDDIEEGSPLRLAEWVVDAAWPGRRDS